LWSHLRLRLHGHEHKLRADACLAAGQKPWIVPIPGTRKLERLDENLGAINIELAADDLGEINQGASSFEIQGARGTGRER